MYIERYLSEKELFLKATTRERFAFINAELIIIATPTNYDNSSGQLDTSSVEKNIERILEFNKKAMIVIRSTVSIGFCDRILKKFNYENIFFNPEFLREVYALYDNLYPSRIIVGANLRTRELKQKALIFAKMLKSNGLKRSVKILIMNYKEAESVKLFSNTYLAMRVSFFNELDTYCEIKNLDSRNIVKGVCLDKRIGDFYNNPSFGSGGCCLPKDSKQLKMDYKGIPNKLINCIV